MVCEDVGEKLLIKKIIEKDRNYENFFYKKYKIKIKNFLKQKYPIIIDVDDSVSEIITKVFINIESFDSSKSKLDTWICNIAKNHIIDKFKTKKKICITNLFEDETYYTPEYNYHLDDIKNLIDKDEFILFKKKFDGYKYSEIAEEYNTTPKTISNKINYIRKKIIKRL